jgi:hypothetical protein
LIINVDGTPYDTNDPVLTVAGVLALAGITDPKYVLEQVDSNGNQSSRLTKLNQNVTIIDGMSFVAVYNG